MDPNLSPPLLQSHSNGFFSFSDGQNDCFSGKNDIQDVVDNAIVRGSIAERRAVKCGFKAEKISTPRFRTTSPLASPVAVRSPFITIPSGISPTALLDSPMMLPNAQPSPTTGTFPFDYGSTVLNTVIPADGDTDNDLDFFRFKPHTGSFAGFATVDDQGLGNGSNADFRAGDFQFPVEFSNEARAESHAVDSATDMEVLNSMNANAKHSDMHMSHPNAAESQTSRQIEPVRGENICTAQPPEEEKATVSAVGVARNSEDGYNWRKYGQKQVKGSEYPRSYYKCTHPNCEVKKKIERSYDGQITEIIYKGTHNHPKPQPSRRAQVGSAAASYDEMPEMDENSDRCVKGEVGSVWKSLQPSEVKHGAEWKLDGLERTSSASVLTELSDPTQGRSMGPFDSAGTPDFTSSLISNDDDDDGATHSHGADADADESEAKRRKMESCLVETTLTSRAVREPRVVVQIESEIDILDDGYRWRKYGQKVVKGNPNPRSYYKCTSAGCQVRKHVERASHNLKFVITTYEAKHNHDVPAARNSSNAANSTSNLPHIPHNSQPVPTLARNTTGPKPEKQIQDYAPGFDRKPMINNDYLRPIFTGNLSNEMKLGAATASGSGSGSSNYQLKLPPNFQHTSAPYGSFGIHHHQSGSIASLVPDFAFSMPPALHHAQASANLSLAGVEYGYRQMGHDQQYLSGQQLFRPKQEQRDENGYDAAQSMMDHVNANPSSSSLYHQMMGNFPS
ncbi:WRKY transcription factor SUSIBA2-like [Euphorbia lathyris]|uniref:WRKY transcription factor SUSIBA2-like n=1 Tax=Euphorbia lathyris TaxID=212925 RepID=UPI0033131854